MIAERIKLILDQYQLSASGLAEIIGVQRSAISHILSQRNRPSLEMVARILEKFPNIDADWLLTGKGTMDQLTLFNEEPLKPKEDKKPSKIKQVSAQEEKRKLYADKFNQIQTALVSDFKEGSASKNDHYDVVIPPQRDQKPEVIPIDQEAKSEIKAKEVPVLTKDDFSLEAVFSKEIFDQADRDKSDNGTNIKKIEKIIVFYDDKTFSVYQPEKQ